jgi:hypothetical protein
VPASLNLIYRSPCRPLNLHISSVPFSFLSFSRQHPVTHFDPVLPPLLINRVKSSSVFHLASGARRGSYSAQSFDALSSSSSLPLFKLLERLVRTYRTIRVPCYPCISRTQASLGLDRNLNEHRRKKKRSRQRTTGFQIPTTTHKLCCQSTSPAFRSQRRPLARPSMQPEKPSSCHVADRSSSQAVRRVVVPSSPRSSSVKHPLELRDAFFLLSLSGLADKHRYHRKTLSSSPLPSRPLQGLTELTLGPCLLALHNHGHRISLPHLYTNMSDSATDYKFKCTLQLPCLSLPPGLLAAHPLARLSWSRLDKDGELSTRTRYRESSRSSPHHRYRWTWVSSPMPPSFHRFLSPHCYPADR